MSKKARIIEFDILKGIGIISVIAGHVAQNYNMSRVMQSFYSFHMPLFFIIAGYFINISKSTKEFCISRGKKILGYYTFTCFVLIAVRSTICWIKGGIYLALKEGIKWIYISIYGIGNGRGSIYINTKLQICHTDEIGMLWFLLALLWAQCIVKFFLRYSAQICQCLVVLTTVIGIISVNYIWLPFSIQNGMAATIWIYIGYTIKEKNILQLAENNYKYKKIFIILCMLFWSISIMKGQTELYRNYYGLGLLDMLGALAGCIILFFLTKKMLSCGWLKDKYVHWIAWAGQNSLLFYIIHYWEQKISPNNTVGLLVRRYVGINQKIDFCISVLIITCLCTCFVKLYELLNRNK